MRVGILGGTFNPPHLAHLVCAQEAHARLGLDVVVLVPTNIPPHKAVEYDPGAEERLELCRLAVAKDSRLAVSGLELERPGPSYTVDTIEELHARAPEDELTFIVGGDMALDLPNWRSPAEILRLARLGVAERAGAERDAIRAQLAALSVTPERIAFFSMPRIDISSSEIRRRIVAGEPVRYLVPDEVAQRIGAKGLYR